MLADPVGQLILFNTVASIIMLPLTIYLAWWLVRLYRRVQVLDAGLKAAGEERAWLRDELKQMQVDLVGAETDLKATLRAVLNTQRANSRRLRELAESLDKMANAQEMVRIVRDELAREHGAGPGPHTSIGGIWTGGGASGVDSTVNDQRGRRGKPKEPGPDDDRS